MFNLKKTIVLAVAFLVVVMSSAFALDRAALNQQMWTWSSLAAVLHEATHHGSGGPIGPQEADQGIADAQEKISRIVAAITTMDELAVARELAAEFVKMGDFEKEAGIGLNLMLDRQEKYLKVHRDL